MSRKWKLTKATLAFEFAATAMGIWKMMGADEAAMVTAVSIYIGACFAAIATTVGTYIAGNVTQKKVEKPSE